MEKFSNWRDGPTGIHPLIPLRIKDSNIVVKLILTIVGTLLFVLRLPFAIVFMTILVVSDSLFRYIPIGFLSRLLRRTFALVFGRLLLFSMGFVKLDQWTDSIDKDSKVTGTLSSVKLNDIILSNHTSYIDVIYMVYRYSPTFAVAPNDDSRSTKLVRLTFLQMLKVSLGAPVKSDNAVSSSLIVANLSWVNGPLVVFVEGATSNGTGLLATCTPIPPPSNNVNGVHGVTIKYPELYPVYTGVGSLALHFIRLLMRPFNNIEVAYLNRTWIQSLDVQPNIAQITQWFEHIINGMATSLKIRRTKISAYDKQGFIQYWYGYNQNYKAKSK